MEAILTLTLLVTALLVWKIVELNDRIENLDINTRYQLENLTKMIKEMNERNDKEIKSRRGDEIKINNTKW